MSNVFRVCEYVSLQGRSNATCRPLRRPPGEPSTLTSGNKHPSRMNQRTHFVTMTNSCIPLVPDTAHDTDCCRFTTTAQAFQCIAKKAFLKIVPFPVGETQYLRCQRACQMGPCVVWLNTTYTFEKQGEYTCLQFKRSRNWVEKGLYAYACALLCTNQKQDCSMPPQGMLRERRDCDGGIYF